MPTDRALQKTVTKYTLLSYLVTVSAGGNVKG